MAYSLLNYTKFLAEKAQQKKLVTFQQFADEFEIKTIRSTTAPLKKVAQWTKSKGLPPLNLLVVVPEKVEEGYVETDAELIESIKSVNEYPWHSIFLNLPAPE